MKFGEYMPDLPERDNPGLTVAKNCLPLRSSYKSVDGPLTYSNALTARCQGAASFKDSSGIVYTFAGDATTLYQLSSAAFASKNLSVTGTDISFTSANQIDSSATDLSIFGDEQLLTISGTASNDDNHTINGTPSATQIISTGSPAIVTEAAGASVTITRQYMTGPDARWEFVKWGDKVIAVNGHNDPPQQRALSGSSFDDLTGSPPKARHIAVVDNFVLLGNIDDGAVKPNVVCWSGFNSETSWTKGVAQSDSQEFYEGGAVQRVIGGEYGIVFQEQSIRRLDYAGPPTIFTIREVEKGRGTPAPWSVVSYGRHIFYWGGDGFYRFHETSSTNIGTGKIDKTFLADLDETYLNRVTAAIDPINTLVYWSYAGLGNSQGNPNRMVVYNWSENRWAGPIEISSQHIFQFFSEGYTLEGLDAISGSIDALAESLDSRLWMGGNTLLATFDENNRLATMNGPALDATLETGLFKLTNDISYVSGVRPDFEGSGSATIKVGRKLLENDSISWSSEASQNLRTGYCDVRSSGRYHKVRLKITDGFDHATGIDPKVKNNGLR